MNKAFHLLSLLFLLSLTGKAFSQQVLTEEQFLELGGKPLNPNIQEVKSVKYVYEIASGNAYFVSSRQYKFHYEYCHDVLGYPGDIPQFNAENYNQLSQRKYLLGNLNLHDSLGWFIDLSVLDHQSARQLEAVTKKLKMQLPFLVNPGILVNSNTLFAERDTLQHFLRIVTPNDLAASQPIQVIQRGTTTGRIYIADSLHPVELAGKSDILVAERLQNELPLVRGIILREFITPLSHISLLAQNRKMPLVVDKNSDKLPFRHGDWVNLRINQNEYRLIAAEPFIGSRKNNPIQLKIDTTIRRLIPAKELHSFSAASVGNKALNFGRLAAMDQQLFSVPEAGFAIPVAYFREHLRNSGAWRYIVQLENAESREAQDSLLKLIRRHIHDAPVPTALVSKIDSALRSSTYTTFRFRSSTNAEDAEGFNGAGLYTSTTVDLNDSSRTIVRALKKVWASCYTEKAYRERADFQVSETDVGMAVLVHRSFPDEGANGVVLTTNRYRSNYPGISVNVQQGDVSVVNPPEGIQCDEVIVQGDNMQSGFERSIEYINFSTLNDNKPVCSDEELYRLEEAVAKIKTCFWNRYARKMHYLSADSYVLDLEFKFDGPDRKLYIKQVRNL